MGRIPIVRFVEQEGVRRVGVVHGRYLPGSVFQIDLDIVGRRHREGQHIGVVRAVFGDIGRAGGHFHDSSSSVIVLDIDRQITLSEDNKGREVDDSKELAGLMRPFHSGIVIRLDDDRLLGVPASVVEDQHVVHGITTVGVAALDIGKRLAGRVLELHPDVGPRRGLTRQLHRDGIGCPALGHVGGTAPLCDNQELKIVVEDIDIDVADRKPVVIEIGAGNGVGDPAGVRSLAHVVVGGRYDNSPRHVPVQGRKGYRTASRHTFLFGRYLSVNRGECDGHIFGRLFGQDDPVVVLRSPFKDCGRSQSFPDPHSGAGLDHLIDRRR